MTSMNLHRYKTNRIVRRSKDNLKNSQYKKIYDLWWELY